MGRYDGERGLSMIRRSLLTALLSLTASCSTLPAQQGAPARETASNVPGSPTVSAAADTAPHRYRWDDEGDPRLALPEDIDRALQTDERVLSCPAGTRDGVSQFARDWVGVRRLDLNADGRPDWIVNGLHGCLQQPHAGYWWLYEETPRGRRVLLRGAPAATLVVLPTRSAGYRDLEAYVVGGRGAELIESYRYDGEGYRPTPFEATDGAPPEARSEPPPR